MVLKKINVLLSISTLGHGGAERVVINLLKHFNRQLFDLSLLVEYYGPLLKLVPSDVKIIKLEFRKGIPQLLTGPFLVSKVLKKLKPDVILTNLINMNFYTMIGRMISRTNPQVILINHNNITLTEYKATSSKIIKRFIPYFYPKADYLLSVSNGCTEELRRVVPNIQNKQLTLYNPVWDEQTLKDSYRPIDSYIKLDFDGAVILSVGRLVYQKDHSTLLKALKVLREKYNFDSKLFIIGDGEVESLKVLAESLGIAEFVYFCGEILNPYPFFRISDVFVLSSICEGMGLVIVEALALGCPVVSTDAPFGPAEILDNGKYGLLTPVENPEALAYAIFRILNDKDLRENFVKEGLKRAQDYRADIITKKYEKLIRRLIRR